MAVRVKKDNNYGCLLTILFLPIILPFSIISGINGDTVEKNNKKKNNYKKIYGLTNEEADLVKKGEYQPWNFSEPGEGDELEDDDYYFDDQDDF